MSGIFSAVFFAEVDRSVWVRTDLRQFRSKNFCNYPALW